MRLWTSNIRSHCKSDPFKTLVKKFSPTINKPDWVAGLIASDTAALRHSLIWHFLSGIAWSMTGHNAPFFGSLASSSTGNLASFDTAHFTQLSSSPPPPPPPLITNLLQYKCTAPEVWNTAKFTDNCYTDINDLPQLSSYHPILPADNASIIIYFKTKQNLH
jgi:hypothetical protein